jgi:hypothetical protein
MLGATPAPAAHDDRGGGAEFPRDFAPSEGLVKPQETPFRAEICLNGSWQFQAAGLPPGYRPGRDPAPELPPPDPGRWEVSPIKIPSPWNANALLMSDAGAGGDFRAFPSYPKHWESARMGWLRRSVVVPSGWRGRRILLHLEAVAGECRVVVNGKDVGRHFDTSLPLELDVTEAVRFGAPNEVHLGIRDAKLFMRRGRYGSFTYPTGSFWLIDAVGVWQDAFLLAVPVVHVTDVFVKPRVDRGLLEAEIEVENAGDVPVTVAVDAPIAPWINRTDFETASLLDAPEIRWELGDPVLRLASDPAVVAPGRTHTFRVSGEVRGELKPWEIWGRGQPHLYAMVAEVRQGGRALDRKYERFGWREYRIRGREFLLNGRPIHLFNEFWHFTGVPALSRRHAYAWYTMARAAHINQIRPHAMPHPRFYYDLADEMGMLVLDESAFFASHVNFNYDAPELWDRAHEHIRGWVRRDRNHPSVMGWGVANEVWCAMQPRDAPRPYKEALWDRVAALAGIARHLDPTRPWVQSDGDRDLEGRLPVFTIHWGDGPFRWDYASLPEKPWGVTEGGSSYYGRPSSYTRWVGDRAFRSFSDRMDALAIEDYGILKEVRAHGGACNVTNLCWHGLKPLPLGLRDRGKKTLDLADGIHFRPFVEGKPGIQPERLGPYCTTLNPGYDPTLPVFDPWPLYLAAQAALDPRGPQPCRWDAVDPSARLPTPPEVERPITAVGFLGRRGSPAHRTLEAVGLPLVDAPRAVRFVIIDAAGVDDGDIAGAAEEARRVVGAGGTALVVGITPESQARAGALLGYAVTAFPREAAALLPDPEDGRTASLPLKDLYFAEDAVSPLIARHALAGDFARRGRVLLMANNTDWRRWIGRPEFEAPIGVYRSELEGRRDPVLVEVAGPGGRYLGSTLVLDRVGPAHLALYRRLFANLGVALGAPKTLMVAALDEGGGLQHALGAGRFGADDLDAAVRADFLGEATIRPRQGTVSGGVAWTVVTRPNEDRFLVSQLNQQGPTRAFAVYFSFWIDSPRNLDDLLGGGPDAPRLRGLCYAASRSRLWLNGRELAPGRSEPADDRTLQVYERLPLEKGWNHLLIKVVSGSLDGAGAGSLVFRVESSDPAFLRRLLSATERPGDDSR